MENKVTIIIPSRNIDYLLENCISQIRNQYKNIKIVLVLDSIDNNLKQFDQNIKIIKSENTNMSAKRNLGVDNVDTKYIAFIDSDAYPNENWLEYAINFLEKNNEYCAVTGSQYNPPTDSFEQQCLRIVRFSPLFTHKEWCIITDKNTVEQDCTKVMTSNVIMKRKIYCEIKGMNENIYLAEDNEFSDRIIDKGFKIRFIPKVSVFHRECKFYPFMRKIYCMSYYYTNSFIKGKKIKSLKETIFQFLPLLGIISFVLLWIIIGYLKINPYPLLIFPLFIICLLIKEAYRESGKLSEKRIEGFLIIFLSYLSFCTVWVYGTFLGIINFPIKKIQKSYKHY